MPAPELLMLLHVGVLCNESEIIGSNGIAPVTGSPTENALIDVALARASMHRA